MADEAHNRASRRLHWARGRRDGGLRRLAGVTKSIGLAVVVASGALAVYLGRTLPGHHTTQSVPAASTGTTGTSGTTGTNGTSGTTAPASSATTQPPSTGSSTEPTTITPTTQAPSQSTQHSNVVSGAT